MRETFSLKFSYIIFNFLQPAFYPHINPPCDKGLINIAYSSLKRLLLCQRFGSKSFSYFRELRFVSFEEFFELFTCNDLAEG